MHLADLLSKSGAKLDDETVVQLAKEDPDALLVDYPGDLDVRDWAVRYQIASESNPRSKESIELRRQLNDFLRAKRVKR